MVNAPGDAYEQEADRLAEHAVNMPMPATKTLAQAQRPTGLAETHETGLHQAPACVKDGLNSSSQTLDASTRAYMEPRFGHDFSHVRVHSDAQASASAKGINASAYTVGSHIAFGSGEYQPNTPSGRQLIAHELAHVVQQTGAASNPNRGSSPMQGAAQSAPVSHVEPCVQRNIRGDDPKKENTPPPSLQDFKRAFLDLKLPPEPEIQNLLMKIPKKEAMTVGGYKLSAGELPKIPKDYDAFVKSNDSEHKNLDEKSLKLLLGGDKDNGITGAGVELKTPLSPLLQKIGTLFRNMKNH